jgi:hypothetical protein
MKTYGGVGLQLHVPTALPLEKEPSVSIEYEASESQRLFGRCGKSKIFFPLWESNTPSNFNLSCMLCVRHLVMLTTTRTESSIKHY